MISRCCRIVAALVLVIALGLALWLLIPLSPMKLTCLQQSLQYVFLLRVQLLSALFLGFLWLLCTRVAPQYLANLGVLQRRRDLALVTVAASVAAFAVAQAFLAAYYNLGARYGLSATCWGTLREWLGLHWTLGPATIYSDLPLAALLVLPTLIWIVARREKSSGNGNQRFPGVVSVIVTFVALVFVYMIVSVLGQWLNPIFVVDAPQSLGGRQLTEGYRTGGVIDAWHIKLLVFWVVVIGIYLVGYRWFSPKHKFPALLLLLLLFTHVSLILSGSAFFLDYYRVPVLLPAILFGLFAYTVGGLDHRFKLTEDEDNTRHPTVKETEDALVALLKKRLAIQASPGKTLVVVAAAGGGIHASAWTAKVLSELDTVDNGKWSSLSGATGLISGVSGGAVGTMFYVNSMTGSGAADPMQAAQEDNLDAVGWGLAYPDFWRLTGFAWLIRVFSRGRYVDRGTALEEDWERAMRAANAPERSAPTFSNWRKLIEAGGLPITVFNATWVKTGRPLLLSPVPFPFKPDSKLSDFYTYYSGLDLNVATAARLSATFPFVTPIARDDQDRRAEHLADGGYFDNFGVHTALSFLYRLFDERPSRVSMAAELKIKRILLIEIRAFADPDDEVSLCEGWTGWLMQALGPLLAMFNVRRATQVERNDLEGELLDELASDLKDIDFRRVRLAFPKKYRPRFSAGRRYTPPLSWKLSNAQKRAVDEGWTTLVSQQQGAWAALRDIWHRWHSQLPDTDVS